MDSMVNGTRSKSGFSLFEVLAVMAVIAVISAISYCNYMAWIPGIRLNGAARQVMSDLVAARMASVKENVGVVVTHLNNHSYSVTVGSGTASMKDLHPNYPETTLSFTSVLFSSRGTTSPRTLTLQNAGGVKSITVAISGRVKIN